MFKKRSRNEAPTPSPKTSHKLTCPKCKCSFHTGALQEPSPTTPITPGPKSAKIQRRLTMILKEKEDLTEEQKAAILKKVRSVLVVIN